MTKKHQNEPPQVKLTITTDLYQTADFLRELANAIENEGTDITEIETSVGMAEIDWPDEAYDDEN